MFDIGLLGQLLVLFVGAVVYGIDGRYQGK